MKVDMFSLDGKKAGTIELPPQCTEEFRPDIILRSFRAYQSHNRQPYGAYTKAGQRQSAELSRRRRKYKTSYGHGISRVPRKALWKRGRQFGWVGAFAPGMVGGRRAHPPKAQKIFEQKINKKERQKALRSALTATFNEPLIRQRGHRIEFLPAVLESKVEALDKTKDIEQLLLNLKLANELQRISTIKIRAGKGKMRNRPYKVRKGPLFVVSKECPLLKAAKNISGIDVCTVNNLNINLLAPGGMPGRLTIYSADAIKKLAEEQLFTSTKKSSLQKKEEKKQEPTPLKTKASWPPTKKAGSPEKKPQYHTRGKAA